MLACTHVGSRYVRLCQRQKRASSLCSLPFEVHCVCIIGYQPHCTAAWAERSVRNAALKLRTPRVRRLGRQVPPPRADTHCNSGRPHRRGEGLSPLSGRWLICSGFGVVGRLADGSCRGSPGATFGSGLQDAVECWYGCTLRPSTVLKHGDRLYAAADSGCIGA